MAKIPVEERQLNVEQKKAVTYGAGPPLDCHSAICKATPCKRCWGGLFQWLQIGEERGVIAVKSESK